MWPGSRRDGRRLRLWVPRGHPGATVGKKRPKPCKSRAVRTALTRLTLTDFRSYAAAELVLDGRPGFLVGPNGTGKTNLLEAGRLLRPGRGLRGASLAEVGRRLPGESRGRA